MSHARPKSTVSLAVFRDRYRDEVLIVSDMAPHRGRPKKSILADLRCQITGTIGARLINALVQKMETDGEVFEPSAQFLYEIRERTRWARNQLNRMASTNFEATDEDPFRRVEKMYGEIVTVGYQRKPGGGREACRINRDSATPAELHIIADMVRGAGRRTNKLHDQGADALSTIADMSATGETFGEARARHYDSIRLAHPVPPPVSEVDGDRP